MTLDDVAMQVSDWCRKCSEQDSEWRYSWDLLFQPSDLRDSEPYRAVIGRVAVQEPWAKEVVADMWWTASPMEALMQAWHEAQAVIARETQHDSHG